MPANLGTVNSTTSIALATDLGGLSSGTSNPGSPSTDDLFYRTDLDLIIFYDGTRWLSTTLYRETFGPGETNVPATADSDVGRWTPWHSTYDLWLVAYYSSTFVLTTNDGTKFWTCELQKRNSANASTSVVSFTTAADAASTWVTRATAIGALLTPGTYLHMQSRVTKTSTPGNLYFALAMSYRLVVT